MKNIKWFYLYASLLTLAIVGCTHPSEPASTPPTVSELYGSIFQLDTTRSNFDTSVWEPSLGTPVQLLHPDTVARTNSQAYYGFYHLNVSDPTLSVSLPGYASVSIFHAGEMNSYPEAPSNLPLWVYNSAFDILLVPNSWLAVTLDNFYQNIDTSIETHRIGVQTDAQGDTTNFGTLVSDTQISTDGLYTIAHIHSMRTDKPSLGYVSLYISTKPGIDPTNPSTYDLVYGTSVPPLKDSNVKIVVLLGTGDGWQAGPYAPGTLVYCKAYAYPFPHEPLNLDSTGKKYILYGMGRYPSNTVTFNVQ